MKIPMKFQFNHQDTLTEPIEEIIYIQANSISVLAMSTACQTPVHHRILSLH